MFGRKPKAELAKIDEVIERLMFEMAKHDPSSREYGAMLGHFERAVSLRSESNKKKISWDTVIIAGAGLLQVLVIVAYEQKHVFTSKGVGFILKSKHSNNNP